MPNFTNAARSLFISTFHTSRSSSPSDHSEPPTRNVPPNELGIFSETVARSISELNADVPTNQLTIEERNQFVRFAFGDCNDDDEEVNQNEEDEREQDDDIDDDKDEEDDENSETGQVVQSIFRAHIVDKTRQAYHRSQKKFISWIFKQATSHTRLTERYRYRLILHSDVLAALTEESHAPNPKLEQKATPFVMSTSENFHPINLSRLRAQDFVA